MKQLLIAIILFLSFLANAQSYKVGKATKIYYFANEIITEVLSKSAMQYPRPNIPEDSFFNFISKIAIYPELAKSNYLEATVRLATTVNEEGKITALNLMSEPNQLFDTAAIKLIMSTNGKWKPAKEGNKNVESNFDIDINYNIRYSDNKIYYRVVPFLNTVVFLTDSNSNHPALLIEKDEYDNEFTFIKTKYKDAADILFYNDTYGTVTVGFNIDTNGSIDDVKIINSVNSKLDSAAIKYIRSTDKKWIPTIKNNQKRISNKEFDIMYFQFKTAGVAKSYYDFLVPKKLSYRVDFENAKNLLEKKEYAKALTKFNLVCKFILRNPEPFYYRGLTYINLGNAEKGCEDIIYAKYLAEQYGYPLIMDKEKIETFLRSSCGEE